jgi:hypothetical protein
MVPASSSQPTIDTTAPPEIFGDHNTDQQLFTHELLSPANPLADVPPIRIEALHAMKYGERLCYFQEVEHISLSIRNMHARLSSEKM